MVSGQIKNDAKISQLWDIGQGVTHRVIDIINQCRYLASKRGMNLKEIRSSMREDEAKQRQLARYTDICSQQMQFLSPSGINDVLHCGTVACPTWLLNNHGMIYSQYNVQNYGKVGQATVVSDPWCYLSSSDKRNQRDWEYYSNKKDTIGREEKVGNAFSSEDNILKKESSGPRLYGTTEASLEKDRSNESMMNLLYSANMSNRTNSLKNDQNVKSNGHLKLYDQRLDTSSSELINIDFIKAPVTFKESNFGNEMSLDTTTSALKCNLPARKLASHNLASLCAAEGDIEDESKVVENAFSNSSLDSDLDFSEIQVVEEIDHDKTVVSPLIKKVESAFADLQKNDSLFGTMDDFGHLMTQANRLL